jgi:hypothetical protein
MTLEAASPPALTTPCLWTTFARLLGGYLILARSTSGTSPSNATFTYAERMADAQAVQLACRRITLVYQRR